MTKQARQPRCGWCGGELPKQEGPGRRRRYCKQGCRQQAHMARKLSAAHGLGADDLIISRHGLEQLQAHLYALHTALEDTEGDLDYARTEKNDPDYREAYEWLAAAARPLSSIWIEPKGI